MLCFHSPFFCLRGGIHTAIGVLTGHHVLSALLGRVRTFHLLPLHRCIHCMLFLRGYIFLQILVVSLKAGSWCIRPCTYGCSVRNHLRPCTCILIWCMVLRYLYGVSWWSSLMLVCWYLLDNLSDSLLQWVLFYESLFFVVGHLIPLSHMLPFCPLVCLYGILIWLYQFQHVISNLGTNGQVRCTWNLSILVHLFSLSFRILGFSQWFHR